MKSAPKAKKRYINIMIIDIYVHLDLYCFLFALCSVVAMLNYSTEREIKGKWQINDLSGMNKWHKVTYTELLPAFNRSLLYYFVGA